MYDIVQFGSMLNDNTRLQTHLEAIRQVARDKVVLDLGSGTGFFALAAVQAGARHVYAIESNSYAAVGRSIIEASGMSDRITTYHADSRHVTLPERVDVVIADIRGTVPFSQPVFSTWADVRERFAHENTIFIPLYDQMVVSGAYLPYFVERVLQTPWQQNPLNIPMTEALPYLLNRLHRISNPRGTLVLPGQVWARIQYREGNRSFTADIEWQVDHDTLMQAYVVWFVAQLLPDISFTSCIWDPQCSTSYGNLVLLLEKALLLRQGDRVLLHLAANRVDVYHVWQWHTRHLNAEGDLLHEFKQNNLSQHMLETVGKPQIPPDLRLDVDMHILQAVKDKQSAEAIVQQVKQLYPVAFTDEQALRTHVFQLLARYNAV